MKPKIWIAVGLPLAIAVSLAAALPLGAQQATPLRVAVIDGDRVIEESNIGRSVQQQAESKAAEWTTRIEEVQAELTELNRQRQEGALTLNQEALARLDADIEEKQVQINRLRDDAQREFTRLQLQYQDQINAALVPAVERLAQQDGFDLILDTRINGLLYFSDAIDVTDRFIALVNEGTGDGQQ